MVEGLVRDLENRVGRNGEEKKHLQELEVSELYKRLRWFKFAVWRQIEVTSIMNQDLQRWSNESGWLRMLRRSRW
jgi:hypothetical protein